MFLPRNPSDGATNDLSYLKTFFNRDIIHPLHLILSPIPLIAEPDVIFSSCLPLPFISRALSADFFFLPKSICTVMSSQYHQTIVVYGGTSAFLYCCLKMPELRGRNSDVLEN